MEAGLAKRFQGLLAAVNPEKGTVLPWQSVQRPKAVLQKKELLD